MSWKSEALEQARLNGKGSEREARQWARIAELEREIAKLREALAVFARGHIDVSETAVILGYHTTAKALAVARKLAPRE